MNLYFVRHGETDWNCRKHIQGSVDIELNKNGMEQAERLGKQLQEQNIIIDKIYSSRQKRARKTAEIIARYVNRDFEVEDGLEEMSLGVWEGKTWTEVMEKDSVRYQLWQRDRRYKRTPEGESYQDVLDRLLPCLLKIINNNQDLNNILIVTHSAVIMTLCAYINQTPFHEMYERYNIKNAEMLKIEADQIKKSVRSNQ